ncbi:Pectinesterase [Heracleum sosnowskyi]|uniref:pectinesterase n=1 Tax=Heracleum sosnowskyi TaxID=360622 RepID=A0AAD8IH52_9APIA|nr:Pectinesterase [Heracleum sosnowskyi]
MGLSKTVTVIGVSSIVLVAVAIAVAVTINKHDSDGKFSTANKSVKIMCEATDYKDACAKSLSSANTDDPKELIKTSFKAAVTDINDVVGKSKTFEDASKDSRTKEAYQLCKDLLETSVNDLDRSGDKVGQFEAGKMEEYVADVRTWLTGAIDYQETCIDAFQNTSGDAGDKMKDLLKSSYELSSNSLAMVGDIKSIVSNLNIPGLHRRLFEYDYGPRGDPPPSEDPGGLGSGSHRRLFEYDYGPRGDPPPSEDPGGPGSGSHRRLFEYDYGPRGDPPPSEDPGGPGSGSHRKLFEYDYGPRGDPPPSEDPGVPGSGSHRRIFEYDYGPRGDPPPSEDPGVPGSGSHRRLFEYDYGPRGDPPPSEDPGGPGSGSHRRLFEYDYGPRGDPPPSEDPGGPGSGSHRRLFEYDYGPRGDPPPSEDPGGPGSKSHRRLFDAAYGPPSDHSVTEDPGQGVESTVRKVFDNDNEPPSDDGTSNQNAEHISKGARKATTPGDDGPSNQNAEHISKGARKAGSSSKEVPKWAGTHQRNLLQGNPKPNVVVALDGSGQFKSINEALKTVPPNNVKAYVILVKAGIYHEYVDVPRLTHNVVMIGEGATKTKVTGNKNFIDGVGTFKTATFAVNADGFMAKDMGFENSAGAAKHQAVALRVSGDRAIFFQCQMDGFQDTLYTHTYRQFYRDCTITGTIDFIFGDAAVVFQNCKMIVRKPMDNQGCMVTAQGRKDSRSTGGNILQGCQITAEPAFMQTKPPIMSYLGRPWKEFSRTVVMQSFIDSNIAPQGWSPWTGNFGMDTCYYAEYQNKGPGSDTSKRVAWKGIQKNLSPEVISQFTAGKFLQGDAWIPVAAIPYDSGMMKV